MKLADVILRQAKIGVSLEDEVHHLRVADHLLLVACQESRPLQVRQQGLDLDVEQLPQLM